MKPLAGVRVVELAGVGPGPFTGMVLADLGASVVSLHRPDEQVAEGFPGAGADRRGRHHVAVDLKDPHDQALVRELMAAADVLIEGFRPGVAERLGLGPDDLRPLNPRLVYGRVTGYGRSGPLAQVPGHDINFLAIAGVLDGFRREGERPLPPLNLVGDYGGGAMLLALGVVCALFQAQRTGQGEVVDAAMVDGAAQLATLFFAFSGAGAWGRPGTNALDTGAPFYEVYATSDGGHMAVGAIEPQFYAALLAGLMVDPKTAPQWDKRTWAATKERFSAIFATRSRAEWAEQFEYADACVTPVLTLSEAPDHPHAVARGSFVDVDGLRLPAPAPRFGSVAAPAGEPEASTADVLATWPVDPATVSGLLRRSGPAQPS